MEKENKRVREQPDIPDINRNELVDISTVKINTELPVKERIKDFIRQIKNPYCYLDNGIVVNISFAGKTRFEDCIKIALLPES